MYVAGIDAGTQSIKVVVYDSERKEIVADASHQLELITGDNGLREQKASWWIDALKACFSSIGKEVAGKIEAISVSGQQHGFVPVGKDGEVLYNVKLWCDTSTAPECRKIEEAYGGREKIASKLGNPILPGYTASKILWLKENHPDIYQKMEYVMLPHDYLNYYLSGRAVMERGDASGTGLMNIFTSSWDEKAAAVISGDLIEKLPEILPEPCIIGTVSEKASAELGLSTSCKVASGGGDNMMSAIGTGAVSDGDVTMSLGTSGTLFASSSKPFYDKKNRLASFASSHGTWLPLLCTMNCTVASELMRAMMELGVKEFDAQAEASVPGAHGLYLLPFFNGERIPDLPNGKGVLAGMTMSNVTKEDIARTTLEGVTYEFLLGLEAFREDGIAVKQITLTGGGSKSPFWRQLAADMTGCPVRVARITEAAAFGSALQALWLCSGKTIEEIAGEHLRYDESKSAEPDAEKHKLYQEHYRTWIGYVDAMTPLFR